jgi:hypothetical protein
MHLSPLVRIDIYTLYKLSKSFANLQANWYSFDHKLMSVDQFLWEQSCPIRIWSFGHVYTVFLWGLLAFRFHKSNVVFTSPKNLWKTIYIILQLYIDIYML